MPSPTSVVRLVVTVVLIVGYGRLSGEAGRPALDGPLGLGGEAVMAMTITLPGDERIQVRRDGQGAWRWGESESLSADADRLLSFLIALRTAPCRPAASGSRTAEIALTTRSGREVRFALGERRAAFRKQRVLVDGAWFEVDADLSAILGLWEGARGAGHALLRPLLFELDGPVRRATLRTPFATYAAARTDEEVRVLAPHDEAQREVLYRWRARQNGQVGKANTAALHRWAKRALCLNGGVPVPDRVWRSHAAPYALELESTSGRRWRLAATGRINAAGDHLVRLVEGMDSAPVTIPGRAFDALFPSGRSLVMEAPRAAVPVARITRLRAERDGHVFEVSREEPGVWSLALPDVPYSVYTPEPEPGMPRDEVQSLAETYVRSLGAFRSSEFLNREDPAVEKRVRRALQKRAARVRYKTEDGGGGAILLSAEVPGTGLRLLDVNGTVLVVACDPKHLVPHPRSFLDPAAVAGKEIAW